MLALLSAAILTLKTPVSSAPLSSPATSHMKATTLLTRIPDSLQVVSVGATNGSLSGTFRLRYGDQATVPLDANATDGVVEVGAFENAWR